MGDWLSTEVELRYDQPMADKARQPSPVCIPCLRFSVSQLARVIRRRLFPKYSLVGRVFRVSGLSVVRVGTRPLPSLSPGAPPRIPSLG